MAVEGLITRPSGLAPKEAADRIEAAARSAGLTVFARIDHAAGAASAGLSLRPTELLIVGRVQAGTPLMQAVQSIGIDLPLRMLIWQDEAVRTWLSYDDPHWLAQRHDIGAGLRPVIEKVAAGLQALVRSAEPPADPVAA